MIITMIAFTFTSVTSTDTQRDKNREDKSNKITYKQKVEHMQPMHQQYANLHRQTTGHQARHGLIMRTTMQNTLKQKQLGNKSMNKHYASVLAIAYAQNKPPQTSNKTQACKLRTVCSAASETVNQDTQTTHREYIDTTFECS